MKDEQRLKSVGSQGQHMSRSRESELSLLSTFTKVTLTYVCNLIFRVKMTLYYAFKYVNLFLHA